MHVVVASPISSKPELQAIDSSVVIHKCSTHACTLVVVLLEMLQNSHLQLLPDQLKARITGVHAIHNGRRIRTQCCRVQEMKMLSE